MLMPSQAGVADREMEGMIAFNSLTSEKFADDCSASLRS